MEKNFYRMIELVNEFFDTRNDPDQISVDDEEREHLSALHSATLSELANEDGPVVWILMIPTTKPVMERFLSGIISEKQLLKETRPGSSFDAIYLCSASVLPEFRNKGLAKRVTIEAINNIRKNHKIETLFYLPFSDEGKLLAASIAREAQLPLLERTA